MDRALALASMGVVVSYAATSVWTWASSTVGALSVLWTVTVVAGAAAFVYAGIHVQRSSNANSIARLALLCGALPPGLLMVARLLGWIIEVKPDDGESALDSVVGSNWTDLVKALQSASGFDRPWLAGELVTIALAWSLLLHLPSIRTSTRQRSIVHAGGIATSTAVVDLALFGALPDPRPTAAITSLVVGVAALIVLYLAWKPPVELSPSLRWMERLVVPGLLVAAAVIAGVRATAGSAIFHGGQLSEAWKGMYAAMAFLLLACPASALVVLLHDYLAVGGRWGFRQLLAARESPAELRAVLRRLLDDDELDLVFLPPHGRSAYGVDGRPTDLSGVVPSRIQRVGSLDDWPAAVVWSDAPRLPDDRVSLVLDVASMAIERAQLQTRLLSEAELLDANRRLVVAMDEARRQIERDLHDGAQAQLLLVQATLHHLMERTADPTWRVEVGRVAAYVEGVVHSIRDLSRGIVPQSLSSGGVAAAVEQLTEQIPIAVACDIVATRYDRVISTTAYMVIAEALTNATRHSAASVASVRMFEDGDVLVVSVSDLGIGGARTDRGSGLRGLVDRVAGLGGVVAVDSAPGSGTTVTARIPLRDEDRLAATSPEPSDPSDRSGPSERAALPGRRMAEEVMT